MANIGIIGSGVAGMHLALSLQQRGIQPTVYAERTPDEIESGRLLNSVLHHKDTIAREEALGINHWKDHMFPGRVNFSISGPPEVVFYGDPKDEDRRGTDYRMYLPRLMQDFEDRGGRIEVRSVDPVELDKLADKHDLVVVAAGRGGLAQLFQRRAAYSPFDRPQRRLCVALWHGVGDPPGFADRSGYVGLAPGEGELAILPFNTFSGPTKSVMFWASPGSDLEVLADLRYDDDPEGFRKMTLAKLRDHFPFAYDLIDEKSFEVVGPLDVLQGGVAPVVREDYIQLSNGKYALSIGDAHLSVDPIVANGGNVASYSAKITADAIAENLVYDELFCQTVARRREEYIVSAAQWSNMMLEPEMHLLELFGAMAESPELASQFVRGYNRPDLLWSTIASAARTAAAIDRWS